MLTWAQRSTRAIFAKVMAIVLALGLVLAAPMTCGAYAVLAHEAIIDSAWDTNIKPLLLKRFPLLV